MKLEATFTGKAIPFIAGLISSGPLNTPHVDSTAAKTEPLKGYPAPHLRSRGAKNRLLKIPPADIVIVASTLSLRL
jgi:hypothetical protein